MLYDSTLALNNSTLALSDRTLALSLALYDSTLGVTVLVAHESTLSDSSTDWVLRLNQPKVCVPVKVRGSKNGRRVIHPVGP